MAVFAYVCFMLSSLSVPDLPASYNTDREALAFGRSDMRRSRTLPWNLDAISAQSFSRTASFLWLALASPASSSRRRASSPRSYSFLSPSLNMTSLCFQILQAVSVAKTRTITNAKDSQTTPQPQALVKMPNTFGNRIVNPQRQRERKYEPMLNAQSAILTPSTVLSL